MNTKGTNKADNMNGTDLDGETVVAVASGVARIVLVKIHL
jgi:hypothetical protein